MSEWKHPLEYAVEDFEAEIKQLKAMLDVRSDTLELRWRDVERLEAEIERLRATCQERDAEQGRLDTVIVRLTAERNDYEAEGRRHIKTIAELRHEIEQLKGILKDQFGVGR